MSNNKRYCHEYCVSSQKGQSSHENMIKNAQDKKFKIAKIIEIAKIMVLLKID